jgi:hypothetical protein
MARADIRRNTMNARRMVNMAEFTERYPTQLAGAAAAGSPGN